MAHSNVWSNRIKKCHRTSVFHNLNSRSIFGSDVVQPFLINSSKGMYIHRILTNEIITFFKKKIA